MAHVRLDVSCIPLKARERMEGPIYGTNLTAGRAGPRLILRNAISAADIFSLLTITLAATPAQKLASHY